MSGPNSLFLIGFVSLCLALSSSVYSKRNAEEEETTFVKTTCKRRRDPRGGVRVVESIFETIFV